MVEFFYFDVKKDELVFEIDATFLMEPFKTLWKSKRGKSYDKAYNKKEFTYVYFMANWTKKNPYRNLEIEERHIASKKAADLPKEWEPDDLIEDCINFYITETVRLTPTAKLVHAVDEAIMQAADLVIALKEQNKSMLLSLQAKSIDIADMMLVTQSLNQNMQTIFAILSNIEATNKKRATLEKQLKEEEEERQYNVTGGKKRGNREDPK